MEQYIITIDGGTTNTRCILWDNRRNRVGEERREVGVRNTAIDGNNERLKQAVKECLECLTRDNGVGWDRIHRIIASGMITSDVGLVVVPHLTAPAGLAELAEATVAIQMPEICPIPIYFIPGIKNFSQDVTFDNFEAMDIMRGEEVESIPIIEKYHNGSPMILVLPGSHNKFVAVDENRKMTGCLTSISGELLASITNDTIIAKSVGKRFLDTADYDREWLLQGYRNAKKDRPWARLLFRQNSLPLQRQPGGENSELHSGRGPGRRHHGDYEFQRCPGGPADGGGGVRQESAKTGADGHYGVRGHVLPGILL